MQPYDELIEQIEAQRPQTPRWDELADKLRRLQKRTHAAVRESSAASDYWRQKLCRTLYFLRFEYGHVQRRCTACNGSGYYDHNGSPDCGCCDGSGKESVPGPKSLTPPAGGH